MDCESLRRRANDLTFAGGELPPGSYASSDRNRDLLKTRNIQTLGERLSPSGSGPTSLAVEKGGERQERQFTARDIAHLPRERKKEKNKYRGVGNLKDVHPWAGPEIEDS